MSGTTEGRRAVLSFGVFVLLATILVRLAVPASPHGISAAAAVSLAP